MQSINQWQSNCTNRQENVNLAKKFDCFLFFIVFFGFQNVKNITI